MTEPDVAITDYLLAAESFVLTALLAGPSAARPDLGWWFIVLFAATGVAALLGGTVHGFFIARPSRTGRFLWRGTMLALGVTTSATWMIGAHLLWPDTHALLPVMLVAAEFIVFATVVVRVSDAFLVAVLNHVPATMFLIAAYILSSGQTPETATTFGLAGLAFTIVSGLVQRLKIAIHRTYFTHNALCHVVQGVALLMLFWSARSLVGG